MREERVRTGLRFPCVQHAVISLAVALLWLASCATPAATRPAMTVTFRSDSCAYTGPQKIRAGEVAITQQDDGRGQYEQYAVFIATLDPGKTVADLKQAMSDSAPAWVHQVTTLPAQKPGDHATTLLDVKEGPLYLICFVRPPLRGIGVIGPIGVEK
jgi:hypothetical protein